MIFLFKLVSLFLTGVTVCIDPGHGGTSTGAVGEYALEKDVVLEIALLLQNWLSQVPGVTRAALTRDGDYDVSLQTRSDYANAGGFDCFVSIHENAFNGSVQGTETFCGSLDPSEPSFQMATLLQNGILDAYDYTDRGVKDGSYLHVIRETFMPAILGEGSFLDYDLNWNESYLYAFNVNDHTGIQAWSYADALCSFQGFSTPEYGNGVIILDNLSAGFSVNDSTLWQVDSSGAPWMGSCLLGTGGGDGAALWTAPLQVTGEHVLQVWWTSGSDRSSSACFRVFHSSGITDVFMDQLFTGGGEWTDAGTFSFDGSCTIELLCSESSSGTVVADAVRLVPPLGVEETPVRGIRVLENPCSSFTILFPGSALRSVEILDLSGRVVDRVSGSGTVIWVPRGVPSGVYFAIEIDSELSARLVLLK
jgi:hypothetical protein